MKSKQLTKAEEDVMQLLWELDGGFVKDLIAAMPEPKPAYNTVSTILRILETKGFVGHTAYGKSHRYHALIQKENYRKQITDLLVKNYFGGSAKQLLSFFLEEQQLDIKTLDELMEHLQKQQKDE